MAFAFAIISILLVSQPKSSSASKNSSSRCFESIVSFGDSLADTGNYPLLFPPADPPNTARPPYGRTFFHHPTGRCSDGRLVIDFFAQKFGLPLVQPYLAGGNFSGGVNFAVVGATSLDYEHQQAISILNSEPIISLRTQLEWFRQFLSTVPDPRNFLHKSLVVIGEIGGNDYFRLIVQGIAAEAMPSFIPPVINSIGTSIEELIKLGAETILVPGILPVGCLPYCLTTFKSTTTVEDYDPETGCLIWLNSFARHHNELLLDELNRIRDLNPRVIIIYGDYYNAVQQFYLAPAKFGFEKEMILRACCGGGGPYNYNATAECGTPAARCCENPSSYVSWDGLHSTEASYKLVAQGMLEGPYAYPPMRFVCPSLSRTNM